MLQVIDTGVAQAEANMIYDAHLLEQMKEGDDPILHLYGWEGASVTFGHFISLDRYINREQAAKHQLNFARRPTGGGIVFHLTDLAFSFLMPSSHPAFSFSTLENYAFVNSVVLDVVKDIFFLKETVSLISDDFPSFAENHSFCMARPTQYDVVYEGKKIAGAAQRRRRQGYLHQGTISLAIPSRLILEETLLVSPEVFDSMFHYTFAPLGDAPTAQVLGEARVSIQQRLVVKLLEKLSISMYLRHHGKKQNSNSTDSH
jgi:lipoate-protein ligase A